MIVGISITVFVIGKAKGCPLIRTLISVRIKCVICELNIMKRKHNFSSALEVFIQIGLIHGDNLASILPVLCLWRCSQCSWLLENRHGKLKEAVLKRPNMLLLAKHWMKLPYPNQHLDHPKIMLTIIQVWHFLLLVKFCWINKLNLTNK